MVKKTKKENKEVDKKLRVISTIFYIFAVLSIIAGILTILFSLIAGTYLSTLSFEEVVNQIISMDPEAQAEFEGITSEDFSIIKWILLVFGLVFGSISIVLGVLYIFVAKGIVRKKRWAWIVAIVLVVLGLIKHFLLMMGGFSPSFLIFVLLLVLGYFLSIDKDIRRTFE